MSNPPAIPLPVHAKPVYGSPCNHCGLCCMLSLCRAALMVDGEATAPCKHLKFTDGNALCGLVLAEKNNGLPPLLAGALGIGIGCTMQDPGTTRTEVAALIAKHTAHAEQIKKNLRLV